MNRSKKWLIPVALICLLLASLIGCSEAPASLGEIFDPSGNPFANRFTDISDLRTATYIVAASDSVHKFEADYRCDGDNDQVQINTALAAASGAHVFLLEGTFYTEAAIVMGDNDSLVGSGPGTVITFPDTLAAGISAIEDSNPGGASHDIVLENFTLDGNSAGVAGGNQTGITIDTCGSGEGAAAVPGIIIRNLVIKDFKYEAMWLEAVYHSIITECKIINTDGVYITTSCAYCQITENEIFKSEYYHLSINDSNYFLVADNILQEGDDVGLSLTTVSDSLITGNLIRGTVAAGGIYLNDVSHSVIADNECMDGGSIGIDTSYITHSTIVGNHCENNGADGIYLSHADDCVVAENHIMGNSQGTDNTDDGIFLILSDRNDIHNNTIRKGDGANTQRYGINVSTDTCDNNRIFDNDLYDSGSTGKVNDVGTGTISPSVVVPFSDGTDPQDSGFLLDLDTEIARAYLFLPNEVQQVRFLKIYARGLTTEADAMRLEINVKGAADNQVYTTHATAAPDTPSTSTNIAADDVIYWTLTSAQILALSAGDSIEVKVLHEAAGGADVETNAYFRTVEIGYF